VTANRLLDGRIVWLSGGGWDERIGQARCFGNADVETVLVERRSRAQADGVVGVYGVQVGEDRVPVTMRERIRAFGPSVHPDFAPISGFGERV